MRVTRQSRWMIHPDLDWLPPGDIQGDALQDIETSDNKLSVYRVENEEDTKQVVFALAANREFLSNLDYAIFDDSNLTVAGIVIQQQDGQTPHDEANKLHYDLSELTARRLVLLAQAVASGEHCRVPWKDIKIGLQQAIRSRTIDRDKIKPKLLERIE